MSQIELSPKIGLHNDFGEGLPIGASHYRSWVGPPAYYDLIGAWQFNLLTLFGMRETSSLLDIGCGSLRGGRFSLMYLRPGRYFGLEPNAWATQEGLQAHFGQEFADRKAPTFIHDGDFTLTAFGRKFDYLMAHSIFTHASAAQIRRCLHQAAEVLEPNGVFLATFHENAVDYAGDEWVYPGITQYRQDTITLLVEEAGLSCRHLTWPHPFDQKWFVVTRLGRDLDVDRMLSGSVFSYDAFLERKASS